MPRLDRVWIGIERIAVVAVLVASATVVWRFWYPEASAVATAPILVRESPIEAIEEMIDGHVLMTAANRGEETAKFAIVEFSDYQCPFCGSFAANTYQELQREFVETGLAKYVFLNNPLPSSSATDRRLRPCFRTAWRIT